MIRSNFALVAAYLIISSLTSAAFALSDDNILPIRDASSPLAIPQPPATPPNANGSSSAINMGSKKISTTQASLPKRALGYITGTIVGTPVCIVRKAIDEEKYGIAGIVGTSTNKAAVTAAGVFWLPFAMVTGAMESPVYAAINSLNADEPFSKEQFSLSGVKPKPPATQ